jgi:tetratricopeptide (TPR) repeat protein
MLARLAAVGLWLGLAVASAWAQAGGGPCTPASAGAIAVAAALSDDGDPAGAEARLREAFEADPRCRPLAVAYWATLGAVAAAHAATRGGPVDLLAPVTGAMAELELVAVEEGRLSEAEYARAALLAARAAAQDERDEMRVWLTHARAVATRLDAVERSPRWPASIDMLEGGLWLEVDRYAEAAEAYERSAAVRPTVAAWIGLAQARERLGRHEGACAAWRGAMALADRRPDAPGVVLARLALADCYR